jgi:hypothetical protein
LERTRGRLAFGPFNLLVVVLIFIIIMKVFCICVFLHDCVYLFSLKPSSVEVNSYAYIFCSAQRGTLSISMCSF